MGVGRNMLITKNQWDSAFERIGPNLESGTDDLLLQAISSVYILGLLACFVVQYRVFAGPYNSRGSIYDSICWIWAFSKKIWLTSSSCVLSHLGTHAFDGSN